MIFSRAAFSINALLALTSVVDVFSFTPSLQTSTRVTFTHHRSTTLNQPSNNRFNSFTSLYAEEGEEVPVENDEVKEEKTTETSSSSTDDILNSPAFLKRKLEVLQKDVAQLDENISNVNGIYEENKAEWGSQIDALRNEYTTISERMKQKIKEGSGQATIEIARKILEVVDNFDRAFGAVSAETDAEKEVEAAYKKVYDMVIQQFEELGVKQVETVGSEFNYEFHQAVMMRPYEGFEEGIVCEEMAKGFAMEDGTLIRAAMVVVAA
mmetsp:Transcript_2717/g.3207  ORF Transcript_2717/g.3207 Transcript_2717/m.3207 type:complete len:267 (-) Transcript_2717:55-855(-)